MGDHFALVFGIVMVVVNIFQKKFSKVKSEIDEEEIEISSD